MVLRHLGYVEEEDVDGKIKFQIQIISPQTKQLT